MRTKRSLAFVLAMVMILALIPASAFAETTNSVTKTLTVASDTGMPPVQLDITSKDQNGMKANVEQKIKLSLENGKWNLPDKDQNDSTIYAISPSTVGSTMNSAYAVTLVNAPVSIAVDSISVTEKTLEFSFTPAANIAKDGGFSLLLNIKSGAAAGEVKVKVDGLDSQVSSGTYTVGIVGDGNSIATVADDATKVGRTEIKATAIEIREVAVNSIQGAQKIKLTLPKGVTWKDGGTVVRGDMVSGGAVSADVVAGSAGRDLMITFTAASNNAVREVLTIVPYICVGKDAKFGDIEVQIRGQLSGDNKISDASGLKVAIYGEESVTVTTVKEADLPQILAGRAMKGSNTNYTVEVTLEEIQKGSLIPNRYVDFSFPEWVQVATGKAIEIKKSGSVVDTIDVADPTDDVSSFEWLVPENEYIKKDTTNKVTFIIPVTVDASETGDIDLTVDGSKAGVNASTIVVGNAVAPVTVEVVPTDVRTGVQNQVAGDIIIKETTAGAIRDESGKNVLQAWIDSNSQEFNFSSAKVEVTAGDLELKKNSVTKTKGTLGVVIDRTSIKTPAVIKITGVEMTLNRTPAEGKYDLCIGGSSIVDNSHYNDDDFSSSVVDTPYLTVVTPADGGVNATFVIGQSSYISNGVSYTMDAAPYIDANGRTMVPIRYVANAIGVAEDQVTWNQGTQTATIFGKYIVSIKMGSNTITSNGTPITMDTVAVNNAGRIYVPLRYIANALGASVDWDQATKTAKIYTVKQ